MAEVVRHVTTNATTWGIVASDGTLYTTVALMKAAGKQAFPHGVIGPAMQLEHLTLRSTDNSNADGSQFYYALPDDWAAFEALANDGARDDVANFCSGSGQTRTEPGFNGVSKRQITCVYLRKTVGTDEIVVQGIL